MLLEAPLSLRPTERWVPRPTSLCRKLAAGGVAGQQVLPPGSPRSLLVRKRLQQLRWVVQLGGVPLGIGVPHCRASSLDKDQFLGVQCQLQKVLPFFEVLVLRTSQLP